jgi:hypothetical protein
VDQKKEFIDVNGVSLLSHHSEICRHAKTGEDTCQIASATKPTLPLEAILVFVHKSIALELDLGNKVSCER